MNFKLTQDFAKAKRELQALSKQELVELVINLREDLLEELELHETTKRLVRIYRRNLMSSSDIEHLRVTNDYPFIQ